VLGLSKNGKLDHRTAKSLIVDYPNLAKPLTQVKLHKENHPLRVICSAVNAPAAKLEKFAAKIIRPFIHNLHTVANATEFIDKLKQVRWNPELRMALVDVEKMYPTLPQDLVMKSVRQQIHSIVSPAEAKNLETEDLCRILLTIFVTSYVSFKNRHFLQTKGAPIGYAVSGEMAELVFQELDEQVVATFEQVVAWLRYRDDIFVLAPPDAISKVKSFIQLFHKDIKFTFEHENEQQQIPFLDVLITRHNNHFSHKLYKKPQQTTRTLNFHSNHPTAAKANLVRNEAKRIKNLTEQPDQVGREIAQFREKLLQNNYPTQFINNHLKAPTEPEKQDTKEYGNTIVIPFLGQCSYQIRRILSANNFQVFFSQTANIKNICKTNQNPTHPIDEPHGIVYQIPCQKCEAVYIGETKKTFSERFSGHKSSITQHDQNNGLAVHQIETGHQPDPSKAVCIFKEKNLPKRKALEAATIARCDKPTLNLNRGWLQQIVDLIPTAAVWPSGATIAFPQKRTNARLRSKPTNRF
jgi:hypothetical protein